MNQITKTNDTGAELFNEFFKRLKTHYPAWRQQLKSQEEHDMFKQELAKTLFDNRINTQEQLNIGLDNASKDKSSWLPAAGAFLEMCQLTAENLGLPSVEEAYREAIFHTQDQEWSCSLVYFSMLSIQHELRTLPEAQSFKIFKRMYEAVLDRILKGEELSAPPKPLPPPEKVSKKTDPKIVSGIIEDIFKENGWKR